MIDESEFFVVVLGRMYLRHPEVAVVGQTLDHAFKFESFETASAAIARLRETIPSEIRKKGVSIKRVRVEDVSMRENR